LFHEGNKDRYLLFESAPVKILVVSISDPHFLVYEIHYDHSNPLFLLWQGKMRPSITMFGCIQILTFWVIAGDRRYMGEIYEVTGRWHGRWVR
jgi:hypothetical protein